MKTDRFITVYRDGGLKGDPFSLDIDYSNLLDSGHHSSPPWSTLKGTLGAGHGRPFQNFPQIQIGKAISWDQKLVQSLGYRHEFFQQDLNVNFLSENR